MHFETITVNSPKTEKGEPLGYATGIVYVKSGGKRECPFASKACIKLCLEFSGHAAIPNDSAPGFFNAIDRARQRRTALMRENLDLFIDVVLDESIRLINWARKRELIPVLRPNGTSDKAWEKLRPRLFDLPIQIYDYTKWPPMARKDLPSNYHLTQSWSENGTDQYLEDTLTLGRNMAVVFATKRGQALPSTWRGIPVIDGDLHDLRFLDPPGVIVGLRAKGRARHPDFEGFVQPV